MNISGFDAGSYIDSVSSNGTNLPNIAIAASGGGYRALMNGAGFLAAADDRTTNSTATGGIGGLLQATTYVAGLSGGGWLVGSIFTNNFSSVTELRDSARVWQFDNTIFSGPQSSGIQILSTANYYDQLYDAVQEKENAGFNNTITDYWGRALSYQLVNATNGGPAYTFSSIALEPNFMNGSIPMPFLVSDARAPGQAIVSGNSTVYEFNPFEFGSWNPTTYAFAPMRYIGSNFSAGVIPNDQQCIAGFDQVGFVMGTSSTLFNEALITLNTTSLPSIVKNALSDILTEIGEDNNDIAPYDPNPFYHYNNDTNPVAFTHQLTLVDGGEDGQNIPLAPVIQPFRAVDVVFAIDSSADTTYGWPNGTSLVATYGGVAFPSVPSQNTFVNLGLNTQPTFFGCNASNTTTGNASTSPLIVYVPNAPYITNSNVSTFNLQYNNTQRDAIIRNGYDVATLGNGTMDSDWGSCVACAILSRSFTRTGTQVPDACSSCFTKYCWNGTVNDTTPANYDPEPKLAEVSLKSSGTRQVVGLKSGAMVCTIMVGIFMFM